MLYAMDSGRITPSYVALCLLAYALYVLSVLCADFHSRGWLPHQQAQRGGGAASPYAASSPRRAGGVSKGRAAGACKGVRAPRAAHMLRIGASSGVKKARASSGDRDARSVPPIEAHFGRSNATDSPQLAAPEAPPPLVPVLTLPMSGGGGDDGAAACGATRCFTSLSIEHTSGDTARRPARSHGCVAVCRRSACSALAAATAPLRFAQLWSIPAAPEGGGDACTWPMLVKSLLSCQVQVRHAPALPWRLKIPMPCAIA